MVERRSPRVNDAPIDRSGCSRALAETPLADRFRLPALVQRVLAPTAAGPFDGEIDAQENGVTPKCVPGKARLSTAGRRRSAPGCLGTYRQRRKHSEPSAPGPFMRRASALRRAGAVGCPGRCSRTPIGHPACPPPVSPASRSQTVAANLPGVRTAVDGSAGSGSWDCSPPSLGCMLA